MTSKPLFGEPATLPAGTATISADGTCRFDLVRHVGAQTKSILFIMLNPSTADAALDDPTIRRCKGYAIREACGKLVVCNLSPWRATRPADLWAHHDDWKGYLQRKNLDAIRHAVFATGTIVVCAWGSHGARIEFSATIGAIRHMAAQACKGLHCLGVTTAGQPRHPLYQKADQPLEIWKPV